VPRDHRYQPASKAGQCRGSHRAWGELASIWELGGVCWDCRCCFGCADPEGCSARRRPGHPDEKSGAVQTEAGAVGHHAVSGSAVADSEPERASAAPDQGELVLA
jgi:hypothetical protein